MDNKKGNISVIKLAGHKIVVINNLKYRGKREEWKRVEEYLKIFIGDWYEIEEYSEKVFISSDFPDEYANSESRIALRGAAAKAKANASQTIPELIQIATNKRYSENRKTKHAKDAQHGWYRYDVRFAIPVFENNSQTIERYNIYKAVMVVRHADDGKKYLYDLVAIKKEMSSPPKSN